MKKINIIILVILAGLLFHSCSSEQDFENEFKANKNQRVQVGNKIGTIDLDTDGYVDFIEIEPGEMLIDMTLSSIDLLPRQKGLNPIELYEFYKHEKAPAELVSAYDEFLDRAEEVKQTLSRVGADRMDTAVLEPSEDFGTRWNGPEFQERYCDGLSTDYVYCWTDKTGESKVTRRGLAIYSVVNAYRGNVQQEVRYWSNGKWKLSVEKTVYQGKVSWIYSGNFGGLRRSRYSRVFWANGDGYHHSISGFD